jgi:hypothetical protein
VNNLTPNQNGKLTKFILEVFTYEIENALRGTNWGNLIEMIELTCAPEDVFTIIDLENWAAENGFVKA